MTAVVICSSAAAILLGILSTVTDLRFHKVRNVHIAVFLCLGIAFQTAAAILDASLLLSLFKNLVLAFCVAIAFYALKIWAAGDAKLFFTMAALLPMCMTPEVRTLEIPSLVMLGVTFTIAMLYVAIESVVLLIADVRRKTLVRRMSPKPALTKAAILSWVTAYIEVDFFDCLVRLMGAGVLFQIPYLAVLLNLLLANASILLLRNDKMKLIVSGSVLAVRIALTIPRILPLPTFSVWTVVIITGLLLLRRFTGRYDYRMIPTETAAEGQVLAQSTIVLFLLSGSKGLPAYSDESTRCRLTRDEAEAIRAWGKTKNGKPAIMIVRNIPFAPFIFLGMLVSAAICFFS